MIQANWLLFTYTSWRMINWSRSSNSLELLLKICNFYFRLNPLNHKLELAPNARIIWVVITDNNGAMDKYYSWCIYIEVTLLHLDTFHRKRCWIFWWNDPQGTIYGHGDSQCRKKFITPILKILLTSSTTTKYIDTTQLLVPTHSFWSVLNIHKKESNPEMILWSFRHLRGLTKLEIPLESSSHWV